MHNGPQREFLQRRSQIPTHRQEDRLHSLLTRITCYQRMLERMDGLEIELCHLRKACPALMNPQNLF